MEENAKGLIAKTEDIEVYHLFSGKKFKNKNAGNLGADIPTALVYESEDPGYWRIIYDSDKKVYEIDLQNIAPTGIYYINRYDTGYNANRLVIDYIKEKNKFQDKSKLIKDLVEKEFRIRREFNEEYGMSVIGESKDYWDKYWDKYWDAYWERWNNR